MFRKIFDKLLKEQKPLEAEYAEAINQNFWYLVGAEDYNPCKGCQKKNPECYRLKQGYTDKCKWEENDGD